MKLILDGNEDESHIIFFPKIVFQEYCWQYHRVHLFDGYNGLSDGLVLFEMLYNSFHKMYDISLCGGNKIDEKIQGIKNIFYDYKFSDITSTHCVKNEKIIRGKRFFIWSKK